MALAAMATPALAADVSPGGPTAVYQPSSLPAGADVSYPQCGRSLPVGQAFGVVGVNDGRADTRNPCLEQELAWAGYRTTGATSEPNASVYVNTGDPGNSYDGQPVEDWPLWGTGPYGACLPTVEAPHLFGSGQDSLACAWEFGYLKAAQDLAWLQAAASRAGLSSRARAYPFWLDVETSNTWQPSTQLNSADLEGMVYGLERAGVVSLGAYAFPPEWVQITGGTTALASGSLQPLSEWILGAGSLAAAESSCQQPPFTGGRVQLAQFPSGQFDEDYAC
jgi:hypothetical protein